ncbi:hypothetical protein SmJEL517_g05746 [Synchytrium microbalum]|uniref:Vacuolar protein sorting-associated protein n=1 Tax=Synchytrium microbalum TaxID=1806994 RepID=A0A507BMA5_9FUNG|nr:uncharacterized protein SmJEL517_g05746 [Synchytrium microbalum]TPX30777.1 hypothetical protein SmJEL517_g05746 [Synchytrium microbalum]
MFEGIIAQVLNKFLGDYVANLETKQLSIGIWKGDVVLHNLRLKKEALDKFNLPVEIQEGNLGELILQIPWNDLKNTPVRVLVNNLYILARPRGESDYDPDEEEERLQAVKKEKIEAINILSQSKNIEPENEKQRDSFINSLVTKIVNNLQISIKNIHFRYEDKITNPQYPFALGLTIGELSAVSTDDKFNENFIQENTSDTGYKLCRLESLAVYWDTRAELFGDTTSGSTTTTKDGGTTTQPLSYFQSGIANKARIPDHQYILKPVSGLGKITLNRSYSAEVAKTSVVLQFDEFAFMVDDEQYKEMFSLLGSFSFMWRREQYRKYRPPRTITPLLDPKAWFKYAGTCILSEIHERNRKWSWDYFAERRDDRLTYIKLHKAQTLGLATPEQISALNELERKLPFEDIRFYRSIAGTQLRKEKIAKPPEPAQQSTVGWIASWWYTNPTDTSAPATKDSSITAPDEPGLPGAPSTGPLLDDAQVKELFETIEFDPQAALLASEIPPATVLVSIQCELNMGSVALRKSPHESNGGADLLSVAFEKCTAGVNQRPTSLSAKLTVGGMKVLDGATSGTLYPIVVQAKPAKDQNQREGVLPLSLSKAPFFDMELDHNPLDGHADDAVSIKMLPLEVIYNPIVIASVITFMTPPASEYATVSTLQAAAKESFKGFTAQTRASLEHALEHHRTLDLKVDIDAPIFVFPESCTDQGTVMLVDAGHLLIESKLVDKKTMTDLESKPTLSETELSTLKSMMYDKFTCNLSSVQALIGPSLGDCLEALARPAGDMHIIEQVNMHFSIEISILPKITEATRTRIMGRLERLHLNLSDRKYKSLMKIIELITGPTSNQSLPKPQTHDDATPRQSTVANNTNWRFLSNSNASRQDLVVEYDSDDDAFYDAPEAGPSVMATGGRKGSTATLDADRVLMEFTFDVGQVSASLKKADRNMKMKEAVLAHLIISDFGLTVQQRQVDMTVDVRIRDVQIEDRMQDAGAEFKYLLAASSHSKPNNSTTNLSSSTGNLSASSDPRASHLIVIKYERIDPTSQHYKSIDQAVDVYISGVDLILTRASVLNLYDFILITFTASGQPPANNKSRNSSMQSLAGEKSRLAAAMPSSMKDAPSAEAVAKPAEASPTDSGIVEVPIPHQPADSPSVTQIDEHEGDSHETGGNNETGGNDEAEEASVTSSPPPVTGTMLVRVDIASVAVVINHDGVRIATARLGQEHVTVLLKPQTMEVSARIGDLSIVDDVPRVEEDARLFKQFLCIDGDQVADFTFSTFSPSEPNYPGHDSEIKLKASSIKITYVEPLIVSLITYFSEFQRMHILLESARRAAYESAQQIQESAGRFHFDIDVQTPILEFPKLSLKSQDLLTLYLGRISASNSFKSDNSDYVNQAGADNGDVITAEVQDLRATSTFHYGPRNIEHALQLLDNVNVKISVDRIGPASSENAIVPETVIRALLPEVKIKMTEMQYQFVLELLTSIGRLTAGNGTAANSETGEAVSDDGVHVRDPTMPPSYKDAIEGADGNRTAMDISLELPSLGLEMYSGDGYGCRLEDVSLARCAITSTTFKAAFRKNNSSDMEVVVHSISILDTRPQDKNLFRDVISSVRHDGHQFALHLTKSVIGASNMIVTVDSPKITLVLDHLFAMRDFFTAPMGVVAGAAAKRDDKGVAVTTSTTNNQQQPSSSPQSAYSAEPEQPGSFSYRVDLVDVEIVLLEDPARKDTEAIILKSQQLAVAHDHITEASIHHMGMFFCAMDKRDETTLRFIQNFDFTFAADSRVTGPGHFMSDLQIDVGPLMLRVSYRDIRLILDIVNQVSDLSRRSSESRSAHAGAGSIQPAPSSSSTGLPTSNSSSAASSSGVAIPSSSTTVVSRVGSNTSLSTMGSGAPDSMSGSGIIMSRERARLVTEGVRLVLIDDLNDLHLPMADLVFNKIAGRVGDWSSGMTVNAQVSLHMNYFNLHNSHWEPVIEPWSFDVNIQNRPAADQGTLLDIYARKKLEMNVTFVLLQTIVNTQNLWNKQTARKTRRGTHTPYVLRNRTGYRMHLWVDSSGDGLDVEPKELKNNDDMPWRFDDWRAMRESTATTPNKISLQLHGPAWESLKGISVDREGITTHLLRPRINSVLHRMVCEVKLKDNIKIVTFRSATVLVNGTGGTVDMMVVNGKGEMTSGVYRIAPGEECPIPIEAAYYDKILVKPHDKQGYKWSSEVLDWKELQRTRMYPLVSCHPIDSSKPPFRFQVNSTYPDEAVRSSYPNLTIKLLPPFQLENLLPHDIRYIVFDKTAKLEYRQTLKKGAVDPVHTLDPTHLLALNIEIPGTDYLTSEVAIISNTELDYRDESISLRDREGRQLLLRVKYSDNLRYGGRKVSLYSPYLLVNKTGMDMAFQARTLLAGTRFAAGQGSQSAKRPKTQPEAFMFSYSNFEPITSRAQIKAGDSEWSKPLSFEAVGSSYAVTIASATNKNSETHIGVHIKEGEGKYYLTKVVTFTPRFVVKNNMSDDVHCRQQGVNQPTIAVKSGDVVPLANLLKATTEGQQQLCIRLTGLTNEWSSPFNIDQIGRVWVKLGRMGSSEEDLVRAEIMLDGPTVFIQLTREEGRWPFRIVNDSDVDVVIGQNASLFGYHLHNSKNRYRIPKGQSRPYAWDQPAASHKALILHVNGRERGIDVMEIGQLVPFKYPVDALGRTNAIMAIQVVLEGPCIVINLKPYVEAQSIFRQRGNTGKDASGPGFEVKDKDADILFTFILRIEGIGLSLINRNMMEILYATARGVTLRYTDTSTNQAINFDVRWLQVDNQLYGGIEPIVLYPTIIKKEGETGVHPVFMVIISKLKDSSYGVEYYNFFTLLLQEFSIDLDEDFLFALLDFSKFSNVGIEEKETELYDANMTTPTPRSSDFQTPLYFEKFLLQPVRFNLSFSRTERINQEESNTRSSTNPISFVVDVFTMTIGNIHDAPIACNALELQHPVETMPMLIDLVIRFYSQEILGQIHKMIGSADFLGNPVGLFDNITSGVRDFFYEPFEGFEITRPEAFGIGLVKGTSSFLKKTVYGVSDTFASFTGSVAKGLSVITLDKEYQEKRRFNSARNKPRHVGSGVNYGAQSFADSVASGFAGIVSKPMEGAEKDGVGGFFKGLAMGVVGVVTKPVVGVFDLASNVGAGVRNTTVWETDIDKQRLPRFIGRDKILKPYNAMEALGQSWLKQVEKGHYFHEDYVGHLELRIEDLVAIVTANRILMIRVKRLKVDWDVPFEDLQLIRSENAGISLVIHKQQAKVRIIPCPDLNSAQFLCSKIEEAFSQYMSERRPTE